jgi:hypothetical protein
MIRNIVIIKLSLTNDNFKKYTVDQSSSLYDGLL